MNIPSYDLTNVPLCVSVLLALSLSLSLSSQPVMVPRKEMKEELDAIINADPLMTVDQNSRWVWLNPVGVASPQLTRAQKELVWTCRSYCSRVAQALPKLLRSVDWADLSHVSEVHR